MIPTAGEILRAMYGCWYLTFGRWDAIELFDRTTKGYWRSFFAAVLLLPAALLADMAHGLSLGGPIDWVNYVLRYAIYWLIFPVVACLIAEQIGKLDRLLDYLVPYNWMAVPFGYIFSILNMIGDANAAIGGLTSFVSLCIWAGLLMILWRWARTLLGISGPMALGFVLADEFFSTIAYLVLESLTG